MIWPLILGELTFWSPLIVLACASLFNAKLWAVFATVWTVWVWLLPAIPIQLAFTAGYAFIFNKIRKKNSLKQVQINSQYIYTKGNFNDYT